MHDLKLKNLFTAIVRVHMSARLYPPTPKGGIIQMTGVRVRYPLPWTRMSSDFRGKWKLVTQQVEQARVNQVIKAKRDTAICMLLGVMLG